MLRVKKSSLGGSGGRWIKELGLPRRVSEEGEGDSGKYEEVGKNKVYEQDSKTISQVESDLGKENYEKNTSVRTVTTSSRPPKGDIKSKITCDTLKTSRSDGCRSAGSDGTSLEVDDCGSAGSDTTSSEVYPTAYSNCPSSSKTSGVVLGHARVTHKPKSSSSSSSNNRSRGKPVAVSLPLTRSLANDPCHSQSTNPNCPLYRSSSQESVDKVESPDAQIASIPVAPHYHGDGRQHLEEINSKHTSQRVTYSDTYMIMTDSGPTAGISEHPNYTAGENRTITGTSEHHQNRTTANTSEHQNRTTAGQTLSVLSRSKDQQQRSKCDKCTHACPGNGANIPSISQTSTGVANAGLENRQVEMHLNPLPPPGHSQRTTTGHQQSRGTYAVGPARPKPCSSIHPGEVPAEVTPLNSHQLVVEHAHSCKRENLLQASEVQQELRQWEHQLPIPSHTQSQQSDTFKTPMAPVPLVSHPRSITSSTHSHLDQHHQQHLLHTRQPQDDASTQLGTAQDSSRMTTRDQGSGWGHSQQTTGSHHHHHSTQHSQQTIVSHQHHHSKQRSSTVHGIERHRDNAKVATSSSAYNSGSNTYTPSSTRHLQRFSSVGAPDVPSLQQNGPGTLPHLDGLAGRRSEEEVEACDGGSEVMGSSRQLKAENIVVMRNSRGLRRLKKLKCIGGGGSSKIFQVLSEENDLYALKEVYMQHLDPVIQRSFFEEVQLLKQLQGKQEIIRLHDFSCDKEACILYILLECADNDLNSLIKSGYLRRSVNPAVSIWQLWNEMIQIVKVIHDEGIIHNDLKPENFVCKGCNLYLIDFGISAKIEAEHTSIERDSRCGTLNYMAPETLETTGENDDFYKVGKPSDIWSLGCILYQMVYRRTPFDHIKHKMKKWQAIINSSSSIPYPQVPISYTKIIQLIQKCLVKDPKKRPTIEELLNFSSPDTFSLP